MEGESKLDDRNTTIIVPVSLRKRLRQLSAMLDTTYPELISMALDLLDDKVLTNGVQYFKNGGKENGDRKPSEEIF